jgi:hypothetical protein
MNVYRHRKYLLISMYKTQFTVQDMTSFLIWVLYIASYLQCVGVNGLLIKPQTGNRTGTATETIHTVLNTLPTELAGTPLSPLTHTPSPLSIKHAATPKKGVARISMLNVTISNSLSKFQSLQFRQVFNHVTISNSLSKFQSLQFRQVFC